MRYKKIIGLATTLIGISLLFFSGYIADQVTEGREKIENAQEFVDKGDGLSGLNPITREISKGIKNSAQKKIDEGSEEADKYEEMAKALKIAGIVLILAGVAIFLKKSKK